MPSPWRWVRLTIFALLTFCSSAGFARASDGRVEIIDVFDLMRRPGLVLVDARSVAAFAHGHAPGSRSFPWEEWTAARPGWRTWLAGRAWEWGKVPSSPKIVQRRLRVMGLSNGVPIAVLGDPAEPGAEGRAAWNLLYWGAEKVYLVDGGYPAYRRAGLPVVTRHEIFPPGDFTIRLRSDRRATRDDVAAALRLMTPLIDVRTEEEFRGKRLAGQKRGGHLPGARLVPVVALYRTDGSFVTADQMRALAPAGEEGTAIAYCAGGVRSALYAVLVEARLGARVRNYDGSLWEWSATAGAPLTAR